MIDCLEQNPGKAFEDLVCTTKITLPSMSGCNRVDHRALTIMGYKSSQKAHSPAGTLTIVRSPSTQFQASLLSSVWFAIW